MKTKGSVKISTEKRSVLVKERESIRFGSEIVQHRTLGRDKESITRRSVNDYRGRRNTITKKIFFFSSLMVISIDYLIYTRGKTMLV